MSRRWSVAPLLLLATPALAGGLDGHWATPLGTIALARSGDAVTGRLVAAAPGCALPAGAEAFRADVLDDSVSGEVLLCLAGCAKKSDWVPALLLVAPDGERLSGALTLPPGCKAAVAAPSAFVAVREGSEAAATSGTPHPIPPRRSGGGEKGLAHGRGSGTIVRVEPAPDPAARKKAQALAADAAQYMDEGRFEKARDRFEAAIAEDPTYAEGYNGIGVTYRARNDLARAMGWYKKSIQIDPTIGDAYYNLACLYALEGKPKLALRFLRTARRNGYVGRETMARDDDLASLHGDPAFRALLGDR